MRHKNNVRQLGRIPSHRSAMFSNMVASFYLNESIITTKQKAKELKKISEKLITKARKNITLPETEVGKKLHNKRLVLKFIKDEDAVKKLFDEIAPRFANRNGGYTRIYLLGKRLGDAADMALIELVEKKVVAKETDKDKTVKDKKDSKDKKEKILKKDKKDKKE
jgi:large subunit ribosomal protein L17